MTCASISIGLVTAFTGFSHLVLCRILIFRRHQVSLGGKQTENKKLLPDKLHVNPAHLNFNETLVCVMCFRAEGGSRESSGTVPLREAKTQRDGAESQQHGGGAAGPEG